MDNDDKNTKYAIGACVCIALGIGAIIVLVYLLLMQPFDPDAKENYYIWRPGVYPGYWGYRVPPWRRRWWRRRRFYGLPLSQWYRPYMRYNAWWY